ncbi:MAG: nucleotidyltransferase domain-containing protein [candidate division WOR-3 bacterium]
MKTLVDIDKEIWEEKRKYFENYLEYCKKIKKISEELLGSVKVLVFGSVVKGKWTPASDIDVLIISENLSENWEDNRLIRTKIKSRIGLFTPFQLHLITKSQYENWFKRFIREDFIEV